MSRRSPLRACVMCKGEGKPLQHSVEIMEIALDQFGPANERRLFLVDKNRDLFITTVRLYGSQRKYIKLATMVFPLDFYFSNIHSLRFLYWVHLNGLVYKDFFEMF